MKIKIKSINIKGIRGAKNSLKLNLNGKSILLYGDNGTGKSSISDSIEWFYTDKVGHLASNEIDTKDALRNATLDNAEVSEVDISFMKNTELNCSKTLSYKGKKLASEFQNTSDKFNEYISKENSENLLFRYKNLTDFIDNTKTDKLKYLSDIIGFSEVTKKKDVLRKCHTAIKTEIKTQGFEAQIVTQKRILIDKIGASKNYAKNVHSPKKPYFCSKLVFISPNVRGFWRC